MATPFLDNYSKAEEETSLFEKTGEFIRYGLPDAVISAGTSFYNTGIALGNFLGGEGEQVRTEDVIDDYLGDEHADYYRANRSAVDVTGLIAGSLLPGTVAVKAGRALAQGTLLTRTGKLATAIQQVALQDKRVDTYMAAIRAKDMTAISGAQKLKLAAQNFGQQASEAAIFEAATLLTMNQSEALAQPEMSHGNLSYFEAIAHNLDTAAFGIVFGGAIGGGIGFLTDNAKLKNFVRDYELTPEMIAASRTFKSNANTIAGDEAAYRLDQVFDAQVRRSQIENMPVAERANHTAELSALINTINNSINDIETSLNKVSKGGALGSRVIETFQTNFRELMEVPGPQRQSINRRMISMLSGADSLRVLDDTDVLDGITSRVLKDELVKEPGLFVHQYPDLIVDETRGIARITRDIAEGKVENDLDLFLEFAGKMEAEDIAKLWDTERTRVRVNFRDPRGRTMPDPTGALTKSGKVKKWGKIIDIQEDLVGLAYQFDPAYKVAYDRHRLLTSQFTDATAELRKSIAKQRKVKVEELFIGRDDFTDDILRMQEELGEAFNTLHDMNNPANLFSTAFRIFNKAELTDDVLKTIDNYDGQFRPLYEWMNNNKALSRKFGLKQMYADLHTGQMLNGTPTARASDVGAVDVRSNRVLAGKHVFEINKLDTVEMTTAQASAQYAHAISPAGGAKRLKFIPINNGDVRAVRWGDETIDITDLPKLDAVLENVSLSPAQVLQVADGSSVRTITDNEQLLNLIREQKQQLILDLAQSKKRNYQLSEVAAFADVDEAYAIAVQTGRSNPWERGEEFFTRNVIRTFNNEGEEVFKPNTIRVDYDMRSFNDLGKKADSVKEVYERIQVNQRANEAYANLILGEFAKDFPTVAFTREGAATLMDDITTTSETAGFLASFNPDPFSGSALIQNIGSSNRNMHIHERDKIIARMLTVRDQVTNNQRAYSELSILEQSTLRSGKYHFMDDVLDTDIDPIAEAIYDQMGLNIREFLEKNLFSPLGIDNIEDYIIVKEKADILNQGLRRSLLDKQSAADLKLAFEQVVSKGDQVAIAQFMTDTRNALRNGLLSEIDDMKTAFNTTHGLDGKQFWKLQTAEVKAFLREYNQLNQEMLVNPMNMLNKAKGRPDGLLDEGVLYPGRFDTDRFQYIAFVKHIDEETDMWAAKGKGMLFGHSQEALDLKIKHFREKYGKSARIITKDQQDDWLKAKQAYDNELAVTDTFVDASLKKDGVLWDLTPEPNPDVADRMINSLISQRKNVINQTIRLKYGQEFGTLEQLDKAFKSTRSINKAKDTPTTFMKHIDQALALDNKDYKLWRDAQEVVGDAAARAYGALRGGLVVAQETGNWEEFAELMTHYGMPKVYEKASDFILSNASAPRPILNKVTAKANSVFSTLMLRMDSAQAIVNAMATPIMLVPELKALQHSIKNLDAAKMQRLGLALSAPIDETGRRMPTNLKIMQQATKNLFKKNDNYWKEFSERGIVGSDVHELKAAIDAASYTSDFGKWQKGVDKAIDFISTPTDMSEKIVKFLAADSARQVVEAMGVPASHPMYWTTIKAFTSRVVGNYNAAQRPALFQGWAGQAIGLFQTYQFNLIQQFMRHIENGNGAAKYMIGLQAGIFGTQSVPGFQLMNQHIGERTLGEKDFYSLTEDTFDSPVAEFMLYGGGSSLTRPLTNGKGIDFFNRGDLTPRTPILIPTSFSEIPAVSFLSKLIGNTANTLDNLGNGAPLGDTFLAALANNGVSRPLAGAAQLIQGEKTTVAGTTMFQYPEVDWAMGIAKLMGSRTLNEGIIANSFYRAQGYRTARLEELAELGEATRIRMRQEGGLGSGETNDILRRYVEKGGNIRTFQRWMLNNYANAHESNVSRMHDNLNNAEGRYMQRVIGGRMEEFENVQFTF